MPLVALSGLTKQYGQRRVPAVDRLTLTVERGEILALLGPSGCGKTTALRMIAGFERPDAGRVEIDGRVVAEAGAGRTVSVPPEDRSVGMVFQDYALFPHLRVEENVAFGLSGYPKVDRRRRVEEVLTLVGLWHVARWYPHELSGGEQQRVALARALAPAPSLLLLDEPFSNLDADLREQMRDEVEKVLRATDTTAIFVTHDQEEAFTIADRVGVLNRGRLEQVAAPETIYHHPATTFVAGFVGAAEFLPGIVSATGIVTEIGVFPGTGDGAFGDRVNVLVRPDDVVFEARPDGEGVIVRRAFRGFETRYSIRLPSGREVHSSQPSSAPFAEGTRVHVQAEALHVVTFPEGETPRAISP